VSVVSATHLENSALWLKSDKNFIITSAGHVFNAETGALLGKFPEVSSFSFVADAAAGRAYYVVQDSETGNIKINAYDINTFVLVGSLTIPNSRVYTKSLVRWGANGLALTTVSNELILIQTSLIPSSEPIPTPTPTASVTPSPTPTPFAVFTREISLPSNDLIYSTATQKLYASVPSRAESLTGNSVTAIDPENGAIGDSIFAGSEPGKFALSDDSKTMYVILNGSNSVRKIDLVTRTPGLQFSASTGSDAAVTPLDVAVKPGAPNTIAIVHSKIAIYDEGVRSTQTTNSTEMKSLAFGSSDTLYGNSGGTTYKYSVTAAGLSNVASLPGISDGDIHFESGLIYTTTGMVVDAETGLVKGTFTGLRYPTAMAIDKPNNRAFFLTDRSDYSGGYAVRAFELDTFRLVGSINLPLGLYFGNKAPSFARWGTNGLAFNATDQIFLLQTSLVNSSVPVPTPTPTITPTPTPSPSPTNAATFVQKVNLPVRDIVYNEATKSLYASVPASAGAERGNTITQIFPETGAIGASIQIGSEPFTLAAADDGRTLYTKLEGENAIRRFDMVSQIAGQKFTNDAFQYVWNFSVLPGKPDSIAVINGLEGVVVYDNGVKRPKAAKSDAYRVENIEFSSSPSLLYGVSDSDDLIKFGIDESGVKELQTTFKLFTGDNAEAKFADGLLYTSGGRVVEPETPKLVGTFDNHNGIGMAVDPALGRIFFINGESTLHVYDLKTYLKIGSIQLPNFNIVPAKRRLVRWGKNGLAVLGYYTWSPLPVRELYLIQSELISAEAPVPTGLQIAAAPNSYESINATFTITRTGDLSSATTVNYETIDGTAKAGLDYTASSGTLAFAPGETSKNIIVPVVDDNVYEGGETFSLKLSNPSNPSGNIVYFLSPESAVVAIIDSDPKPIISVSNITIEEPRFGTAEAVFTVRLTNPTSQTVTVNYATNNGSAVAGSDYLAASGTLTFNPLETTKTVSVKINADALNEGNEAFFLSLTNAVNTANTTGQATVIIRNTARRQLFDYDGDGRADISVFRPADGAWYISNSSNNSFRGTQFGISTDKTAPADFDGDGKTDISVFREGFWYRINSSTNQFVGLQFGVAEDVPVPADFDGDGRADVAVFRPSDGTWYRLNSTDNQFVAFKWGTEGDKPIVGDFDGDNKADYAVYRSSASAWYILKSSDNSFYGVNFGVSEDIPTAADYDGDGKTDISVFRPSAGSWYRLNSSNNQFFGQQFGVSEDKPVAADYDGDGKADIAVFRPSAGAWYIQRSGSGFFAQQFGSNGDVPTPSAFGQ
jgi:hypothetical protein